MFFEDTDNRFLQVVCCADVNMVPLFPEVFEPHVVQGVTDDAVRVVLFQAGQLVACVFNRVQIAVDSVAVDSVAVDGIPDGLYRMADVVNGVINIICYAHFIFPS